MLKYEMDEKEVRQQVTKRGEKKEGNFSPQSLIVKIIESSKMMKKERKKEFTSLRLKHDTAKKPGEENKGRQD